VTEDKRTESVDEERYKDMVVDKEVDFDLVNDVQRTYENALNEVLEKCRGIVVGRRTLYSDAWISMPVRTLQHVIAYKAKRLTAIPWKNREKMLEEIVDIVNLAVFCYARIKQITFEQEVSTHGPNPT